MEGAEFRPVIFEEDYYTLPEAIELICETFGISFNTIKRRNEKGVIEYKTIYQHLRRELESIRPVGPDDIRKEPGKRNMRFSRGMLNYAVNDKLFPWFCEQAERISQEEFKRWKEYRKNNRQAYADFMEKVRQEGPGRSSAHFEVDGWLDEMFRRHKLEIALEFIFENCIELDEELLRKDIAMSFFADEFDPSPVDEVAMERLKDNKNYYACRKKQC